MSIVYACQDVLTKPLGSMTLVSKFKLGPEDPLGIDLRQKYGELRWLLKPNDSPWKPGVMETLKAGLDDYKDGDWLLQLGNPVLMSMMAVFAGDRSERLRFLQWSNGGYVPITVELF
jgi:hypothetical protein